MSSGRAFLSISFFKIEPSGLSSNGATSTSQSLRLHSAISWALAQESISALVLMGGQGYFSNGIALNVIEGAQDPALESWRNINAIDDVVQAVLCPPGVLTFAALRGNAAAGGLAVADACDVVLSSEHAVLNVSFIFCPLGCGDCRPIDTNYAPLFTASLPWSWPLRLRIPYFQLDTPQRRSTHEAILARHAAHERRASA